MTGSVIPFRLSGMKLYQWRAAFLEFLAALAKAAVIRSSVAGEIDEDGTKRVLDISSECREMVAVHRELLSRGMLLDRSLQCVDSPYPVRNARKQAEALLDVDQPLLPHEIVCAGRVREKQHFCFAVYRRGDVEQRPILLPHRVMFRFDEHARPFPDQPAIDERSAVRFHIGQDIVEAF